MNVKFLIIRFSSLGEIVLTTPVIRCLKEQVDGAEIHFAVEKQFFSVLTSNPCVTKIHVFEDNLNDLICSLKKEKYDYIIDLHNNLRSKIIKTRLRLLSFDLKKINIEKWLMVNFKIDRLPHVHTVDRYMDTVKIFDICNDYKGLDFFISENEQIETGILPEAFRNGYTAFIMGARHSTKKLPFEQIVKLCNEIRYPMILIGGPEDETAGNIICQESGSSVFNTCGKYTVGQYVSLIKQANLIITHDTGFMHIAAAFKKRILSVWGNTIPAFGMSPYYPHQDSRIFEVKNLKCRPCSSGGYISCPRKHFKCIRDINIAEMAAYARSILDKC